MSTFFLASRLAPLALLAAVALPAGAQENMRFTGTLINPACSVSDNGGRINVTFKTNIGIEKIDAEQYRQTIPYQISCPGSAPWSIKLTIKGDRTDFDPAAVQTSIPGLGIRILINDDPFILNTPKEVQMTNRDSPPRLEAVPVKEIGSRLPEKGFTAAALLIAEVY